MKTRNQRAVIAFFVLLLVTPSSWAGSRDIRWLPGDGEWSNASRWGGGVPDVMSRAAIHGESEVRVPVAQRVGVAGLRLGTLTGDKVRTRDNWLAVGFDREVRAAQPFAAPPVKASPANEAFDAVLTRAGALPARRDRTDTRIAREVRDGTGRIINKVTEADGKGMGAEE